MCCETSFKSLCDKVECKVSDTAEGVMIEMKPKDRSKIKSLQNLLKSCKDFCDCGC